MGEGERRAPRIGTAMWAVPLASWYARHGRHDLPWRRTRDPWAILVSEVMLQQTSVARVLPRWQAFLDRWPTPAACATSPLADVLREWDGLGYPRRARALHLTAIAVAERGWPEHEAGLRALPGIGTYTARALLTLAFDRPGTPPRDVNAGRVVARAAFGAAAGAVPGRLLDAELARARPVGLDWRHWTYALFDLGALVCRARRADCPACPLRRRCAAHLGGGPAQPRTSRRPPYAGSMRQLRGAVLRVLLDDHPPTDLDELSRRVGHLPAARRPGAVAEALSSLGRDGLIPADLSLR